MKIAIDLDGVCCRFDKGFLEYMNLRLNLKKPVTTEQITTWNWWELGFGFTQEQWITCFNEFTNNRMWQALDVYPYVTSSLCSLSQQGHEIYYLTDRPKEARRATLKFILQNGLPVDGVIFTKNKTTIAVTLGISVGIDDKVETVEAYYDAGINSVLRKHPYNKETKRFTKEVNNMREFHDYILSLEKEGENENG